MVFLNIYDAPHELPDSAIVYRLSPFCSVITKRCGKYANTDVFNGVRHYRERIITAIPSYLRFGKFLLHLSHDCQQHTCRRCNRAGHFANECENDFCFNCEEIGHLSPDCEEGLRCCICKCTSHLVRANRYSWYRSPSTSLHAQPPSNNGQSSGQAEGQQQNSQSDRQNDDFGHSDPPTVNNNNSPGAPANESSESPQQDPPAASPENSDLRPSDRPSPSPDPEQSSGRILDSQGQLIFQPSERVLNSRPTPPMQSSIVLRVSD